MVNNILYNINNILYNINNIYYLFYLIIFEDLYRYSKRQEMVPIIYVSVMGYVNLFLRGSGVLV